MISLVDVYEHGGSYRQILYNLLLERTPEQSISHKEMPKWDDHQRFVDTKPYAAWYLIEDFYDGIDGEIRIVGACYLTHQNEIGIGILNRYQGKGYGKKAVMMLMEAHPGRHLANINPNNPRSIRMFEDLGFKHIQNTYRREE